MKTLKQLMSAVVLLILASAAVAQTETTPNLVYTTVNPAPTGTNIGQNWTGFTNVTSTGGNTTSDNGAVTGYNPNTGVFMFGYNQGTIAYTYAINQALANSGSGIQVRGYNWSWDINNLNYDDRQGSVDTLTARITTFGANNTTILQQDSWTYNTKFDWTTFSGTVNYTNPSSPSDFGNMRIEFSGRDVGFWAGYYGPMVRNIDVRLRYGVDECTVNPQSSPACPGYKTYYNMTDDGWAQVNLPFAFPFYGFNFTTSYMFTNGVIGFLNPNNAPGGYCCDGVDLHQQRFVGSSPWNFAIYALNTDLYPGQQSTFYTETTNNGNGIKYTWNRVVEIGTENENTFSVELRNTGYIGINYEQINLSPWRNPLIGIAGDIYQGGYSQYYFGPASSLPNLSGSTITFTGTETTDICLINPLYNSQCPGYAEAYFTQQCSINALYNTACTGYAEAYFTQQCSINTLYDPACPGYATAYYNYQCSLNSLYHTGCPGYSQAYFDQQCNLNSLYDQTCPGYAQAYFDQQCSLDPLYNESCSGYADAYYVQQCNLDPLYDSGCNGYAEAYLAQQCSLNTLYDSLCPGYAQAYFDQQCSLDPLYNNQCPGYTTAFYNQQCSLDALYDKNCPGYSEAYAKKFILNIGSDSIVAKTEPEPVVTATATPAEEPVAKSESVIEEKIVVAQAETKKETVSTSPASSATAPVSLTAPVTAPADSTANARTETKTEAPKATASSRTAPTTRQAIAQRRLEAAREQAAQAAKENPKETAAAMESATSMEQQVEVQNVVIGAMGFVAGFDAYGRAILPDAAGYKPFEIYPGQRNIDTPAARGLLGRSDRLHQEMINEQYK